MIDILQGSIFDTKCDLIIIPCDTTGSISKSFSNELAASNLPNFRKHMPAGEVEIIENTGSFSSAQMIGYAATVDKDKGSSSKEILQSILEKIKVICDQYSVRKINTPLLGTGVGNIAAKDSFSLMSSLFAKENAIQLCIYTRHNEVYNELSALTVKQQSASGKRIQNPRVFISYSSTDPNNVAWVRTLANKLRYNGVDARLDNFRLKAGQDLPQWMTNEIVMADKVILVCDKLYAQKADTRRSGVGWETMIIQGDMLFNQDRNKYIAILRDEDINQCLPIYMKSKCALNWAGKSLDNNPKRNALDEDFKSLLTCLFDCKTDKEEILGSVPDFIQALYA